MKYEIKRVYLNDKGRYIFIDLWNEEKQINIELKFCDNITTIFKTRYNNFIKILDIICASKVEITIDFLEQMFTVFKNTARPLYVDTDNVKAYINSLYGGGFI